MRRWWGDFYTLFWSNEAEWLWCHLVRISMHFYWRRKQFVGVSRVLLSTRGFSNHQFHYILNGLQSSSKRLQCKLSRDYTISKRQTELFKCLCWKFAEFHFIIFDFVQLNVVFYRHVSQTTSSCELIYDPKRWSRWEKIYVWKSMKFTRSKKVETWHGRDDIFSFVVA